MTRCDCESMQNPHTEDDHILDAIGPDDPVAKMVAALDAVREGRRGKSPLARIYES